MKIFNTIIKLIKEYDHINIILSLKKIVYWIKSKFLMYFVSKHYQDEILFFERIKSSEYSDKNYWESLLRSYAHQIDKRLLSKNYTNMQLNETKKILNICKEINNIDCDLLEWCEQIIESTKKNKKNKNKLTLNSFEKYSTNMLYDLIRARRSIRSFRSDKLSEDSVLKIIEAGLWAPTGCNRQNISFLIVNKKEDIVFCQKMAGEPGDFVKEAPIGIIVLADCRTYAIPGHRHQAYMEAGAAIQNMLLMATTLNLGSIWLNWSAIGKRRVEFQNKYNIDFWMLPVAFVLFGNINRQPFLIPVRKQIKSAILSSF